MYINYLRPLEDVQILKITCWAYAIIYGSVCRVVDVPLAYTKFYINSFEFSKLHYFFTKLYEMWIFIWNFYITRFLFPLCCFYYYYILFYPFRILQTTGRKGWQSPNQDCMPISPKSDNFIYQHVIKSATHNDSASTRPNNGHIHLTTTPARDVTYSSNQSIEYSNNSSNQNIHLYSKSVDSCNYMSSSSATSTMYTLKDKDLRKSATSSIITNASSNASCSYNIMQNSATYSIATSSSNELLLDEIHGNGVENCKKYQHNRIISSSSSSINSSNNNNNSLNIANNNFDIQQKQSIANENKYGKLQPISKSQYAKIQTHYDQLNMNNVIQANTKITSNQHNNLNILNNNDMCAAIKSRPNINGRQNNGNGNTIANIQQAHQHQQPLIQHHHHHPHPHPHQHPPNQVTHVSCSIFPYFLRGNLIFILLYFLVGEYAVFTGQCIFNWILYRRNLTG